jgi:NADH:ubiquinone oxidoreductase subunit 5 (subunit L)/multisubunit Na+/H+ antiporter MnhA subunit
VGLLLLAGLVLGAPAALTGALSVGEPLGRLLAMGLAITVAAAGLAAAVDRDLLRRLAAWTSVQAGLAVLVSLLPDPELGRGSVERALSHLAASAAALPLLFLVLGRVVAFARVADLGAQAGLLSATVVRGQAVLASVFVAVVASAQAPLVLLRALGTRDAGVPGPFLALAIAGWLGAGLALVLGSYRIVRGERTSPGDAPSELGRIEGLAIGLLLAAAIAALLYPSMWATPGSAVRAGTPGLAAAGWPR